MVNLIPSRLCVCDHCGMTVMMRFAAVDVWSVGVIFLSLLAGHYPIFKASDDMEALSQIVCVFGSEELNNAAEAYGKRMLVDNFVALMFFFNFLFKKRLNKVCFGARVKKNPVFFKKAQPSGFFGFYWFFGQAGKNR